MLTIRELIKTLYNALIQRMKKYRGNWEQNDPTADDYIKNRPFYTNEINKEIVVKTKIFTATNSYWWGSPFTFIPVVGETYKVTWDGEEYICQSYLVWNNCKAIGNISINDDGFDTGEPFFYYWYDSSDYGLCVRYQGKHTITIEKIDVKKLDKRYLPDLGLAPVAISGSYYDLNDRPTIYTDVVRYGTTQSLTTAQKTQARTNIGAVSSDEITGIVKYSTSQNLTDEQKEIARTNIGAADEVKVKELISSAKKSILLIDEIKNYPYVIAIRDGNLVTYCATKSIEVKSMPVKTEYIAGEYFDPTGIVIIATTYDGITKEITDYSYSENYLTEDMTSFDIVYDKEPSMLSVSIPITVTAFDPITALMDFTYTTNKDGTYTLTGWKQTLNGISSTELVVPNNAKVIL